MSLPRSRDNHDSFEAVLGRRLELSGLANSSDCADAAVLAAYYDGAMEMRERVEWERHFATCARCQRSLAALARSSGEPRGAEQAGFSNVWRWLWRATPIALAATAAIVVFVIIAPQRSRLRNLRSEHLKNQPLAKAPSQRQRGTAVLDDALNQQLKGASSPAAPQFGNEHPPALSVPPNQFASQGPRAPLAKGVQPYAAGPVFSSERASSAAVGAAGTPGAGTAPGNGAGLAQLTRGGGPPTEIAGSSLPITVESPDRSRLWQIGPDQSILLYSPAHGWQRQNSSARFPLRSGSAPSDTVCWAVGNSGTILRTTDGQSWKTINSPTRGDLVSVAASSAMDAAVVAANGDKFKTTDGGVSWQPE
jgi:hypothetical protein